MRNLRSILLATDLFATGHEVHHAVAALARLCGAEIHLVHAVKRTEGLHLAAFPLIERATHQLAVAQAQLEALGADVRLVPVEFGAPAEVILRHAERLDVDLIAIGCGRHLGPGKPMAGPITETVIQRARQPVLAVAPSAPETPFHRILCPVDHSATSRRGLRNAIRLAQIFRSEMCVLSVVPEVSWLSAAMEVGDLRDVQHQHAEHWRREFEEFLQGVEFGEVVWRSEVRAGSPAEQIVAEARKFEAGLLVMGATGRSELVKALTGSVARKVLRDLPCSILVVKSEDLIEEFTESDAKQFELLRAEAEALLEVGSLEAAVAKFDQVLAHHPFHELSLLRRAEALEKLGQPERAARSRRRAAALRQAR